MRSKLLQIRPVQLSDSECFWQWRNDPLTRAMSLNSTAIPIESHQSWFLTALKDESQYVFVGHFPNLQHKSKKNANSTVDLKVGMVRFDIIESDNIAAVNTRVSISLNPSYRGKGLAKELLYKAIKSFAQAIKNAKYEGRQPITLQSHSTCDLTQANTLVINATIKDNNHASIRTFLSNGFTSLINSNEKQQWLYQLIVKLS